MGEELELEMGTIVKNLRHGSRFLVSQPEAGKYCLIGMRDGNRWANPVRNRTLAELTSNQGHMFEIVKLGSNR